PCTTLFRSHPVQVRRGDHASPPAPDDAGVRAVLRLLVGFWRASCLPGGLCWSADYWSALGGPRCWIPGGTARLLVRFAEFDAAFRTFSGIKLCKTFGWAEFFRVPLAPGTTRTHRRWTRFTLCASTTEPSGDGPPPGVRSRGGGRYYALRD